MNKINVTKWKEFKINDLFEKIPVKKISFKALDLPEKPNEIDTLPLVAAGIDNQGRNRYIDPKYATVLKNCLTISANGANSGATFYQDSDFSILQDAYAIRFISKYNNYKSKNIYLFFASIITQALANNDWNNKATWPRVQKKLIKLPVDINGQPNWDYMDEYIAKLATQARQNLSSLRKLKPQKHTINTQQWKKFKVEDLFNVNSSKKKFNAKSVVFDGNYPYVARGASTNGIRGYIDEDPKFLNPANTISFGQDTATLYYQEKPYFTGDKIQILSLKPLFPKLDEYVAQFLITSMNIAFSTYTWGVQSFAVDKIRNVSFKLPVTANNVPDWQYMRQIIIRIQKNVKFNLNTLAKI